MENSYDALDKLFNVGADVIVLDRIPLEANERYCVFHTMSGDKIPWRILSWDRLNKCKGTSYSLLFQQKLPRWPNQPDASDEFCLYYKKVI